MSIRIKSLLETKTSGLRFDREEKEEPIILPAIKSSKCLLTILKAIQAAFQFLSLFYEQKCSSNTSQLEFPRFSPARPKRSHHPVILFL